MKSLKSKDPDIRGSLPALRRAARRARELSNATNTPLYVLRKGRVVDLRSKPRSAGRTAKRKIAGRTGG
jgi:hypothetical protein